MEISDLLASGLV